MTTGEIRALCEKQAETQTPRSIETRPWMITPHKLNYLLPYSYNSDLNRTPFIGTGDADELKKEETKFQISFKFPLAHNLLSDRTDLYFAYTNQSWWQAYSTDISAPFSEYNHEPELFSGCEMTGRSARFAIAC